VPDAPGEGRVGQRRFDRPLDHLPDALSSRSDGRSGGGGLDARGRAYGSSWRKIGAGKRTCRLLRFWPAWMHALLGEERRI